jgi:PAN domain
MKFKFGLFWSLLLFVLLPIAAFGQTVSIEAGTDRMGGDYKSFALAGDQPALCQQACADDAACKAFTYVKPGVQGRRAMCFLKSSVPPPTPNECCTSGARAAGGRPERRPVPIIVRPGPPSPPPEPEVEFVIPAPPTVTAASDLSEHEVRWTWNAVGCFPGGPGSVPKPCPFVKDIEGFRVYSTSGGVLASIQDPVARFASVGKRGDGQCYFVTAFKGEDESAPSPVGCVDAPAKPLYKLSSAIQTPGNLRMAKNAAECVAASGDSGLLGLICDAAIKSNAQVLLWEHNGSGIDGFRVYDAYRGTPLVVKTEANPKTRLFAVQPIKSGVNVNDYCFTVRAYKGDTESLPSNPVCLTPKGPAPAPVKPLLLIGPSDGISAGGVNSLKNQNNGCLLPRKYVEMRVKGPLTDAMSIYWIHRDSSLCGKRIVLWNEGSIEFPLDAIPADFQSVELRFTSNNSLAYLGTSGPRLSKEKPTFNASCIQSIHAYNITLRDNSQREAYQFGEPGAWFSWIKKELVATATTPNTTHRFDVTALVKRSLAAREAKLGFVWEVNKNLVGDNDMCLSSFEGFALEVKLK